MAEIKHIELSTVKTHTKNLLKKFKVRRISEVIDILEQNDIDKILRKQ
ncbi:MAG: hypothetical protein GX144_04750 [Clostridiaceae bacterium]|nr:hypothetical protein [Clostridiaceae bacterium]